MYPQLRKGRFKGKSVSSNISKRTFQIMEMSSNSISAVWAWSAQLSGQKAPFATGGGQFNTNIDYLGVDCRAQANFTLEPGDHELAGNRHAQV